MDGRKVDALMSLALVSAATLVLELVQVRVFAYSLHPVLAYAALSVAMLGYGLGATAVAMRHEVLSRSLERQIGRTAWWFGLSVLASAVLFAPFSQRVTGNHPGVVDPGWLAVAVLPSAAPHAFGGTSRQRSWRVARTDLGGGTPGV